MSKKSRSGLKETNDFEKKRTVRRFDLLLFGSLAALVIVLLVASIITEGKNRLRRIDLVLSRQWETLFDQETRSELIREFEETYPHLRIRLASAVENSSPAPDIIFFDESRFPALLEKNALQRIDIELANKKETGGWAISLAPSMDLLFYNIDLLSAAGFDRPPKTRDEFLRYAQKVSGDNDGIYGAALALSPQDPLSLRRDFFSWFWASGLSVSTDLTPGFDTRAAADIIAFLGQLNRDASKDDPFNKTGVQRLEEFAQGKIAMLIAPAYSISFLRTQMKNTEFGVTVIPSTSTPAKNSLGLSGWYAGISADCTHPDEAQVFLADLASRNHLLAKKSSAIQNSIFALVLYFSGNRVEQDTLYEKAWDIFDSSDIAENFSLVPHSAELEQIVRDELRIFFEGNISAQNTATAIQKQWAAVFNPNSNEEN